VRISDARDGNSVGVDRQKEDCRALADRLGWVIAEIIEENDVSAFSTKRGTDAEGLPTRTTKRPDFRRAMRQLQSGQNDGLIVYDLDRLTRQPRDLETLIDLVEVRGCPVAVVTGEVDVSTSSGRAMARVVVAFANKSSEDTARRVARAARQRAEQGSPKVDGFRPYGYDRDMVIVEDEAAVVREVTDRILRGETVRSIADNLNARGIPPMRAALWRNPAVKSIVRKPTAAGLRAYTPTNPDEASKVGTTLYPGTWEPIIDRETWEAVCATFAPGRNTRTTGTRYLLSGIAECGSCGARMYVGTTREKRKVYRCNDCMKITRDLDWTDEQVTGVVRELLNRDEIKAARRRQGRPRAHSADAELTALRARRSQVVREFALRLGATDLDDMLAAIDERVAELEADAARGITVILPRAAEFDDLSLARRQEIVRALVRVVVLPTPARGRGLDPESVRITPAY
jgi:DNA invertase Pin-like site-specific DNA recombinase